MAKNINSLQLLRSSRVYTTKEAAVAALNAFSGNSTPSNLDGVAALARYTDGDGKVKSVVGFGYESGDTRSMTIMDFDSAQIAAIQHAVGLNADGTFAGASGMTGDGASILTGAESVEGEIGKLADAIAAMDAASVSGESMVVIDVTQEDGQITASAANLTGVKLAGYTGGTDADIAATDTLGEALGKLQAQINAMDLTAVGAEGSVITSVSEEDGKVSAVASALTDVKLTGYVKTADTGDIAATDDVKTALSKLENKAAAITITNADGSINVTTTTGGTDINVNIKSGEKVLAKDGDAGLYTDIKLSAVTPSSTAVKEEYALLGKDNTQLGQTIKIYKDSSLVSITYITDPSNEHYQNLEYVYIDASGVTKTEYVDMTALVLEAEFASGVTFSDGVAHGVVDPASEDFLTVGTDGFKLSGVQAAIDEAAAAATTVVEKTDGKTHVTVTSTTDQDTSAVTYTIAESDIASEAALQGLSGKAVTAVEMTGGTAAIAAHTDGTKKITINADGSTLSTSTGYTSAGTAAAITAGDSMDAALGKLEAQVAAAKAAATTKVVEGTDAGNNLEIVPTTGADQSVTYTVNLTDVASKAALDAEIAARKDVDGQTGQTYAANSSANYITAATSLNDADVKLDAQLKAEQNEIDAIETAVGLASDGKYVANTANTYTNNAQSVADAINKLDAQVKANADAIDQGSVVAGDGIEVSTVTGTGGTDTQVAVLLKEGIADTWENPLKFDTDGSLYFDAIDAGTF